MENKKPKKIKIKVLIFVFILIAAFIYGSYSLLSHFTHKIIVSYIEELAAHDMKNIQEFVSDRWKTMDGFYWELNSRSLQTIESVQDELSIKTRAENYEHIGLLDEEGRLYMDIPSVYSAEENSFLEFFSTGKEHFVVRYNDKNRFYETPKEYILYGYNFNDKPIQFQGIESKFVGMAVLEDIKTIRDNIRITSFDGRGYSSIIGRDGIYIVTDTAESGVGQTRSFYELAKANQIENSSADEIIRKVQNKENVQFWCVNEDNVRKFVSVQPVGNLGWTFIISLEDTVFTNQTNQFIIIVVGIILLLLVILIVSFFIIYYIRQKNKRLYFDAVGHVYSKQYYEDKLANITVQALAIIDLDHLKSINDTYGHLVGDWAIREFSMAIYKNTNKRDFIFRFGGDEFVLLMRDPTGAGHFQQILENIQEDIRSIRHESISEMRLTCSVGGYYGEGIACEVLKQADELLYQAKENRDSLVTNFNQQMNFMDLVQNK